MATLNNTFEGQTSGTTWSVANSGGGSGDAFSSLISSGTVTPIFDNAQSAHGSNSLHITAAATSTWIIRWTTLNGSSTAFRIYLRIVSSSAAQDIISVRNSGAQAFGVGISATNQIQIKNAAGTTIKSFTALSLNTWYRLEVQATIGTTTSNGTINAQYYAGDSTSPVEAAYASGAAVNAGITNFVEFRFGKLTSAPTYEAFYDNVLASDVSATPLGTSNVTGTGAQTLPHLTQSATGTATPPVFTGTAAQTLPHLTQSAVGTSTTPGATGTATQTLPHLTQSATGTRTVPPVTGASAQTLPHLTQAASGTRTTPTFTGTAAQTLPHITTAVSGTVQNPPGTVGLIAQTLPRVGQAATGTRTIPPRTATVAQTLPHLTQAATGAQTAPVFTATITQTMPALTQTATGTVTPPVFTATGAQALPAITQDITGNSHGPGVDGTITQTLPMLRQLVAGSGVQFNVEWSGAGTPHGNPYRAALTTGNPYRVRTATGSTFNAIGAP